MKKLYKGFSLLELVVVCCILGLVASVIVQSYQRSQKRSSQVIAKADLSKLANQMESFRHKHGSYELDKSRYETSELELLVSHSPSHLPYKQRYYDLVIHSVSKKQYILRAIPLNKEQQTLALYSHGYISQTD